MMFDFARGGIGGRSGVGFGFGRVRFGGLGLVVTRSMKLNRGRVKMLGAFVLG